MTFGFNFYRSLNDIVFFACGIVSNVAFLRSYNINLERQTHFFPSFQTKHKTVLLILNFIYKYL